MIRVHLRARVADALSWIADRLDPTGKIYVDSALEIGGYSWGEYISAVGQDITIPLNAGDGWVTEVTLTKSQALDLAEMLNDFAGSDGPTETLGEIAERERVEQLRHHSTLKDTRAKRALDEQIREGITEAEAGKTVSRGSFAQYLDETPSTQLGEGIGLGLGLGDVSNLNRGARQMVTEIRKALNGNASD